MENKYYVKLEARGFVDIIVLDGEDKLEDWYKAIDCRTIGIQEGEELPKPYVLIVDDESLFREKPVLNPIASLLYGTRVHGQPLFGNVLIGRDYVTEEGEIEVGGYDMEEASKLIALIMDLLLGDCRTA